MLQAVHHLNVGWDEAGGAQTGLVFPEGVVFLSLVRTWLYFHKKRTLKSGKDELYR